MNYEITPAALAAAANDDLKNFFVAITPGGIEAQGKTGQEEFVDSFTLPKDMGYNCTRETLEQMGITFGADVDDLFVEVQLPEGWKKQATEHSMWSILLDEQGRKRASIFYKAAFYDRSAYLILCKRYNIDVYQPYGEIRSLVVKDGDSIIHVVGDYKSGDLRESDKLSRQAEAWLDEYYPDWNDMSAYWN